MDSGPLGPCLGDRHLGTNPSAQAQELGAGLESTTPWTGASELHGVSTV